jgi:hypothetical protein
VLSASAPPSSSAAAVPANMVGYASRSLVPSMPSVPSMAAIHRRIAPVVASTTSTSPMRAGDSVGSTCGCAFSSVGQPSA